MLLVLASKFGGVSPPQLVGWFDPVPLQGLAEDRQFGPPGRLNGVSHVSSGDRFERCDIEPFSHASRLDQGVVDVPQHQAVFVATIGHAPESVTSGVAS